MVKPVDDRSPPSPLARARSPRRLDNEPVPYPYGDSQRAVPRDGKYYFEWTPFTPAIIAWHKRRVVPLARRTATVWSTPKGSRLRHPRSRG